MQLAHLAWHAHAICMRCCAVSLALLLAACSGAPDVLETGAGTSGTTAESTTDAGSTGDTMEPDAGVYCPGYPEPVTPDCWEPEPGQCSVPGADWRDGTDAERDALAEECPPCPWEGKEMWRACGLGGSCTCLGLAGNGADSANAVQCPRGQSPGMDGTCSDAWWPSPREYSHTNYGGQPEWAYPCAGDGDCADKWECRHASHIGGAWAESAWGTCWPPNFLP